MKSLVIKTKNSDVIVFDIEDIESMSFEDICETIAEQTEEIIPAEVNLTAEEINDTPTVSEPIAEEVVEEEAPALVEEEPVAEVNEEIIEEDTIVTEEVAPVQDDIVSQIVDMVTAPAEEPKVEEIVEQVAVATDTNGTVEVKPAEPKKEEAPETVAFTEI